MTHIGFDTYSLLSIAIGTVLPLLVALVTRIQTHQTVKALLLLALSLVTTALTNLIPDAQNGSISLHEWENAGLTFLVTFGVAAATQVFHVQLGSYQAAERVGSPKQ